MEYWASLPGQTRDQAFVFEFEQGHVLAAVEWKDRGDGMGVQRLSLESKAVALAAYDSRVQEFVPRRNLDACFLLVF